MKTDRRDFLKASTVAALFPVPIIGAQSKDKKYRTALIGSGWWGMNILRKAMAARAANRVVQVGAHRRISPHNVSGREFIKSGDGSRFRPLRRRPGKA